MQFTELYVENLRCFAGEVRVPLKPITVVFGANSAGKSTLVRALAWIAHTLVDRGVQSSGPVVFTKCDEPEFGPASSERTRFREEAAATGRIKLGVKIGNALEQASHAEAVWSVDADEDGNDGAAVSAELVDFRAGAIRRSFRTSGGLEARWLDDSDRVISSNFEVFPSQEASSNPQLAVLADLYSTLAKLRYLPPDRHLPASGGSRIVRNLHTSLVEDDALRDRVNNITEEQTRLGLSLGYQVVDAGGELGLTPRGPGSPLRLNQVGQGVTEVLPILAQLQDEEARVVLIEQPELHLHPRMQVQLGDIFINAATRKSNPHQIITETHSEHLLLRILRRIREHGLSPSFVTVLLVEACGLDSVVRTMELNSRGDLVSPWPGGFFEEGLNEIL